MEVKMSGNAKTVVIYKTKYGSAKQYAQWIAEELKCDLFEHSSFLPSKLDEYDTIIYGGSLYAVGILGISLIKNNFAKLKDKKVIVFSVGASPAYEKAMNEIRNKNFTDEMKEKVQYFHLRGEFNYNKLNPLHKFMMWLMKKMIERKSPEERTDDEKGLLDSFSEPTDFKSKENIIPIVESI
jgi:menaquinone-dependent protoporphyrinogen IX oxidase